jgi:hypothetical protein
MCWQDRDGNGVDRMEYVIGMLTHMRILQWSDVQPLLDAFERMDVDGSGRLDRKDLELAAAIQAQKDAAERSSTPKGRQSPKFSPSTARQSLEAVDSVETNMSDSLPTTPLPTDPSESI